MVYYHYDHQSHGPHLSLSHQGGDEFSAELRDILQNVYGYTVFLDVDNLKVGGEGFFWLAPSAGPDALTKHLSLRRFSGSDFFICMKLPSRVQPGAQFDDVLTAAVNACKALVAVVSKTYGNLVESE